MASHNDGLFVTLWGTIKNFFHVDGPDGPGLGINDDGNGLATRSADESSWAPHEAKKIKDSSYPGENQLVTWQDLNSKIVNIIDDFDGDTPPSGSMEVGFYLCSATGSSYNENDIIYWDGTSNEQYYQTTGNIGSSTTHGKTLTHITTQDAITMTTKASLKENALYAWENVAGTEQWVLKAYAGAGNDMKVIKITVGGTAGDYSSSTAIPANAYISKVQFKVTTAYSGSGTPTVLVKTPAETIMETTDNNPEVVNTYEKSEPQEITTGGVATVTVANATAGAGTVYIVYSDIFS